MGDENGELLTVRSKVLDAIMVSFRYLLGCNCATPIMIVAEVLVTSLLVQKDSGCIMSAVILRCSAFNRS